MDSFTERMLKRVEERRKALDQKLAAANLRDNVANEDVTRNVCSGETPSRDRLVDVQRSPETDEDESGSEDEESHQMSNEKENAIPQSVIRSEARKRLDKLGALYSGDVNAVISSPVQQTEPAFNVEIESPTRSNLHSSGLTRRLAALAETINQWEDDLRHVAVKEAQGFARCESHSNLAFDYNKENKRKVRDRSPVKDIVENYNKIEANAIKESTVLSPSKTKTSRETSPVKQITPKASQAGNTKNRYGSPVRMGVGKPSLNVSKQEGTSSGSSVVPAMGVSQLLSPHSSKNQGSVLQKAALFETGENNQTKKVQKDPAELPLSQRKALFEKNAGPAVLPKAPFALPVPPSMLQDKKQLVTSNFGAGKHNNMPVASKITSNSMKSVHYENAVHNSNKDARNGLESVAAKFKNSGDTLETTTQQQVQKAIEERKKELDMIKNRWNQHKNMNETPTVPASLPAPPLPASTSQQRTVTFSKETIINRFSLESTDDTLSTQDDDTYQQQPPSPERDYPGLKGVKKIKVSPPKPGHLYPNLSDVETESDIPQSDFDGYSNDLDDYERDRFESSTDGSSMSEESFGKKITQVARNLRQQSDDYERLSQSTLTTLKRDLSMSSSTDSDMSEESMMGTNMSEFLDEALASDNDNEPTPPKRRRSNDNSYDQNLSSSHSQSFEYSQENKNKSSTNCLPACVVDGDSELPLTYSVSFYRKQTMNREPLSPKRQVFHRSYREEDDESSDEDIYQQQAAVERRISELQQEISRQQTVISQISQFLNLCSSTIEFSGSSEEVEGEKLLLIATQKRQAALHEIQRLKVEGTLRPVGPDNSRLTEKGDLTLSNITLPLKMDNIKLAAREEKCYFLVCLIKSGHQVLSTVMKEALPRNLHSNNRLTLSSPTPLTLTGLYSDFKVTIEVYGMSSRSKEILPHDVKYHISTSKKDTFKLKLTPKKNKHDDKLLRPNLQSPGGPSAVRSPKFALMGFVVFSLREINRTHFSLNKVPYTSVLEGSIEVELSCQMTVDVEHRGFLTMFEDIAGIGAWHRRWCLLKGDTLSYWKYPDDENKKIPTDTIDLTTCITEEVQVASRDICARPNSFLLETSRTSRQDDKPSLTLVCSGDRTIIRHLLSADTKDDRIMWCNSLNKALALLRAWGKK